MCYAVKHVSTFCRIRLGVLLLTQGAHKTPRFNRGGGGGGAHTKTPYLILLTRVGTQKSCLCGFRKITSGGTLSKL
jgi:hypothetical protein